MSTEIGDHPLVLVWWAVLSGVACFNICFWFIAKRNLHRGPLVKTPIYQLRQWHVVLSGIFTLGCGFRSFVPRVDVERTCLLDSAVSSVFLGRSAATWAEMAF